MKGRIILAALLSLVFATTAQAKMNEPPEKCPCVCAIASVGVDSATEIQEHTWIVSHSPHSYNTHENWQFVFGMVRAGDAEEALKIARTELPTLSFGGGPQHFEDKDHGKEIWVCSYKSASGYMAGTITPPQAWDNKNFTKFVR